MNEARGSNREAVLGWARYPAYKESGVEWLGEIPVHWGVRRLKECADAWLSNVDKKFVEGEPKVRLCNYVDVYYHDQIHGEMEFMTATATPAQVRRFSLRGGDVLVTKDSETWTDIAVPALVTDDLADVVCGYHLALIRPQPNGVGAFIGRAIGAVGLREQYQVAANGITRFGLTVDAIRNGILPMPPLPEQHSIARFLAHETAKVDALVAKQQELIRLLQEKRTALISQAVKKGLDPDVAMKDSGVEWLGEIPAHWEVKKLGYITECLDGRRIPLNAEQRGRMQGEYPYWGANSIVDYVDSWLFDEELVLLGEDGAPFFDADRPVAFHVTGRIWVNNHAHVLRPVAIVSATFLTSALNCVDYSWYTAGATRDKLTQSDMRAIPIQLPPAHEQLAISTYLDGETRKLDRLVSKAHQAIGALNEYRAALISAAVTGKIDVRDHRHISTTPHPTQ